MPFRQFVLKIHSRCNLACGYCYMYEYPDQTWRTRPRTMTAETIRATAARIAEHVHRHRLPELRVILHGGEPLLAGAAVIEQITDTIRAELGPTTRAQFHLTTNGVLLTEDLLNLFHRLDIRVSVSMDGGQVAHDRERRFKNGQGSYARVEKGLTLLSATRHRGIYAGILCTVDLRNDPIGVYQDILRFSPPEMDFLLPHGNWDSPPPKRTDKAGHTPYARWLINIFDRWYAAPRRETRIRLFESIILILLGGHSRTEAVGLTPNSLVTVETDGTIEQSDALKTAANGLAATGLDIRRNSFDDALLHPGVAAQHRGRTGLAQQCQRCPVVSTCGGGLYAHRFRTDTGFDNPSVYCPDLFALIRHIERRVRADLTKRDDNLAPVGGNR
nr:FxsB family cyclophane-forming radical SAM/SPASM peptide maturase [Micromonospora sp. DSM 115978]